jgi:ferrochelatase
MAINLLAKNERQIQPGKIGILLVNLGTPDAPRFWPVRQFIKEFLSDRRVIGLPRLLWPQYAAATTASVNDKVFETLTAMHWQPAVRIAPPYYDDATYIDILATSLRAGVSRLGFVPDTILVSFHGLPQTEIAKGDPYYNQCLETWRLLREEIGLGEDRCPVSFQSRFGSGAWLQPYTATEVKRLAVQGAKGLVVIAPGFAADCLETLYELGHENRAIFLENGGENFAVIPCLNDSELSMMLIYDLVARELKGWI